MPRYRFVMSIVIGTTLSVSSALAAEPDYSICGVPLKAALMNVKSDQSALSQSEASSAWQCSFSFKTHDQAIAAGLSVGFAVYGVPLKVGGTWDQKTVDTWKQENCSQSAQQSSFEGATVNYLRQVAPGAMGAFVQCLTVLHQQDNDSALTCTVTRNPSNFTIKWRRIAGEVDSAQPIVQRMMVANGTCSPGISAKTKVGTGGLGTPCTPVDKQDMTISVDTTRGNCLAIAAYPKKVFSIAGTLKLDGDRTIAADVVEFVAQSRVITNGHNLQINAPEVKVGTDSEIDAYEKQGPAAAASSPGVGGGSLVLKTANITGDGDLKIDLTGQDGANGVRGFDGGPGGKGSKAQPRGLHGVRGCLGGSPGGRGGTGGAGGAGSPGGNGGDGGVVAVQIAGGASDMDIARLLIVGKNGVIAPGKGGIGGKGGNGGPGGPGGDGVGGHEFCGSQPGGPTGYPGPGGPDAANGLDGKPGLITIQ